MFQYSTRVYLSFYKKWPNDLNMFWAIEKKEDILRRNSFFLLIKAPQFWKLEISLWLEKQTSAIPIISQVCSFGN